MLISTIVRFALFCASIAALSVLPGNATPSPHAPAGDVALRHDIQILADNGIVKGPVTSWPLAWGPIAADLEGADVSEAPPHVASALSRVRHRMAGAAGNELRYRAHASAAGEPMRIRGFAATPRESAEIGGGISWTGNRVSIDLNGQAVSSPDDDRSFRADGSMLAVALGNFSIAASTLDRWWGPGWDGSLILSNNARPIPALTIDRNFTDAFETKWLSWLGPWDLSVMFGQMESDRAVPDARFLGFRFNFRPAPSLEVGLSRTAQWCGEGRVCSLDVFTDLVLGRDNRGDDGLDFENEPGNQLAGIDFRWSPAALPLPVSVYGQFIGEDEAGGFPSKYLGQLGLETSGSLSDEWSFRWFGEVVDTSCGFYDSGRFNCAYNHGIYATGYRYRGKSVGHGGDNDARLFSSGLFLVGGDETQWHIVARTGNLNRGGPVDAANGLTATKQRLFSIDLSHSGEFRYGIIEIGAGVERIDDVASGRSDNSPRGFVQWRTAR